MCVGSVVDGEVAGGDAGESSVSVFLSGFINPGDSENTVDAFDIDSLIGQLNIVDDAVLRKGDVVTDSCHLFSGCPLTRLQGDGELFTWSYVFRESSSNSLGAEHHILLFVSIGIGGNLALVGDFFSRGDGCIGY